MAARVLLRPVNPAEQLAITALIQSRTAPIRSIERARIIQAAASGLSAAAIAASLGCSRPTAYAWIRRFNDHGLDGLEERRRSGRPPTYCAGQRAEVVATALTDPQSLGLPFASWTMDRLHVYLDDQKALAKRRSRIGEIHIEEGLRWRKQETWFGERVDPDFAVKRGSSPNSTRPLPRAR
ncbi:helix-turn-helix domain-containing protein [Isosphaeraceae bacterium EP7]